MWVKIVQFLLCLSILIVLHECGHFFTAKWFKTRVEKFYLFFNPGFSLFKVQKGETEYGIGWLPLGGYVKISGMIDESFDKEQMAGPPQPWEFRSKPAWQRLIIMLGGVIVNFILGIVIFSFLLWGYGESHIKNESLKYGVFVDGLGEALGLKDGDLPIKVGNAPIKKFPSSLFKKDIAVNGSRSITVLRDGKEKVLTLTDEQASKLTQHENKDSIIYYARMPYVIKNVNPESFADNAGIKVNDQLIAVNGVSGQYFHEFSKLIKGHKGDDYNIDVLRGQDTVSIKIKLDENKIMGVHAFAADHYFEKETTKYSLLASFPAGWKKSIDFLGFQIKAFGQMFKGKIKAKDSLGSLITIGSMFSSTWDWYVFWNMTASLSLLLGFLNLLPIPALDGGHVMFLLFEAITGIKPSDTVIEYATLIGFILLSILMVYAVGLDISRLF